MSCLDNSIDLLLEILTLYWRSSINVRQEEEESTTLKEGKRLAGLHLAEKQKDHFLDGI